MREIVHIQAGQCGNQIGAKVLTFDTTEIFHYKIDVLPQAELD